MGRVEAKCPKTAVLEESSHFRCFSLYCTGDFPEEWKPSQTQIFLDELCVGAQMLGTGCCLTAVTEWSRPWLPSWRLVMFGVAFWGGFCGRSAARPDRRWVSSLQGSQHLVILLNLLAKTRLNSCTSKEVQRTLC